MSSSSSSGSIDQEETMVLRYVLVVFVERTWNQISIQKKMT